MGYLWYLIFYLCVNAFCALITNGDENCSGLKTLRQSDACSNEVALRIPSDGSGVYSLVLNASMALYSKENLRVTLENESAVKDGTADHLRYVVTHPTCDSPPRITYLKFNGRVLCTNEPYRANTKQAATQFSFTSTHYGAKSLKSVFGTNYFNSADQANKEFAKNLLENNFLTLPKFNIPSNAPADSNYPNNPFLTSLAASQPASNNFGSQLFARIGNGSGYPNNPFLNAFGQPATTTSSGKKFTIKDVCGYSSRPLLRGGSDVQPGEFPWLGGLFQFDDGNPPIYICTVNLVTEKHVLTAAHCIQDANKPELYGIIMGHINENKKNYTRVERIDSHPDYRKANTTHDIAVLTMRQFVAFSAGMKPICLWAPSFQLVPNEGMVAGFGPDYTKFKKIEFPIVTQDECRSSHVNFHYVTSDFTFCAGKKNNNGPCFGDSGAGFMQWISDRYYLRGLVSHSLATNGDCNLRQFVIFADLSKEINWIQSALS